MARASNLPVGQNSLGSYTPKLALFSNKNKAAPP